MVHLIARIGRVVVSDSIKRPQNYLNKLNNSGACENNDVSLLRPKLQFNHSQRVQYDNAQSVQIVIGKPC